MMRATGVTVAMKAKRPPTYVDMERAFLRDAAGFIRLLSRPLQMTRDLASFWQSGYDEVRRTMCGRYSRHPWPTIRERPPLSAASSERASA